MERLSEEQMWEVIDGLASPEILERHEHLMLHDSEYQSEFQQYAFLDAHLHKLDLEVPSMRFTENVIDKALNIQKKQTQRDWIPAIYLSAMVLLTFIILKVLSLSMSDSTTSWAPNTEGVVSWLSNPYLLYLFLVVNVFLILGLLDKKIVKPYFDKRLK